MQWHRKCVWDLLPNELKDIGNLVAFKKAIKSVKIILEMSVLF